jgi:hypothetical protein
MFGFKKEQYQMIYHYPINRLRQLLSQSTSQPQNNNNNKKSDLKPPMDAMIPTHPKIESEHENHLDKDENSEEMNKNEKDSISEDKGTLIHIYHTILM